MSYVLSRILCDFETYLSKLVLERQARGLKGLNDFWLVVLYPDTQVNILAVRYHIALTKPA